MLEFGLTAESQQAAVKPATGEVFCSTIIPTINRPTLGRSVCSVLDQSFEEADFEVIVVNDSGCPLPEDDWQHSRRVRVIDTIRRERSVARNTGAAIAKGRYLHFLDDDDILLPGALNAFWDISREDQAGWLYGFWRTVDNNGNIVEEFCPELSGNIFALLISGEGIPLQSSLILAEDFFRAGGFDPAITGVEDRDLGRRLSLLVDIAFVPIVAAQVRIGRVGSSTDWTRLAEEDRWGREKALMAPGSFARVRSSTETSYWHGRVSRAYMASTVWNLKRNHLLTAASRAAAGLYFAGIHFFQRGFWQGVREET
jgi:glycosyltransferase involved in cell wall biosynthesis